MLAGFAQTSLIGVQCREPVRVKRDTKLIDVVTQVRKQRRGAVIIEDDAGRLVGIFTERDLVLRVGHESQEWHDDPVGPLMTENPKRLSADATIAAALALMQQHKIRNIPIMDDDDRVLGIISIRDILTHIAEHFPQEFINLPPSSRHEASSRWGG